MSIINTYVAYRFLRLLVTPFEKTKAFELGVIDQDGNVLKKKRDRIKVIRKTKIISATVTFNYW